MIYGYGNTIHGTRHLNIEVDEDGKIVSVWFRCAALPFDVTVVDRDRAAEMETMSRRINSTVKLDAVDFVPGGGDFND